MMEHGDWEWILISKVFKQNLKLKYWIKYINSENKSLKFLG